MQRLTPGTLLRHKTYRIESVLGQGGFGITYLATDLSLDRLVAIKEFFPKDFCERDGDSTSSVTLGSRSTEELVSRLKAKFVKEAKNIAKLDHPGIIKIHTAFEENNTAYYVMDYIEGQSLSDIVKKRGPLDKGEALSIIKEVGEALQFTHSHFINHLDIKPANIMIRRSDGRPVLIDFGLSKQYDSEGNQTSTTPTGISHGYAPLEQYKSGGVSEFSPGTDVYSLAATFYYMLSGIVPQDATDIVENGISFPKGFPENFKEAIAMGMRSSRKKRTPDIHSFISDVDKAYFDGRPDLGMEETYLFNETNSSKISDVPVMAPERVEISYDDSPVHQKRNNFHIIVFLIVAVLVAAVLILVIFFFSNSGSTNNSIKPYNEYQDANSLKKAVDIPINTPFGQASYTGEVNADGKPEGYGVATWSSGEAKEYEGNWTDGNMNGNARYTHSSGDTFEGTFKDNYFEKGKYTDVKTGDYYEGTFKDKGQPDEGNWYNEKGEKY